MDTSDLKRCRNTGCDECRRDKILSYGRVEIEGSTSDRQRWGNNGSDHCQGMLKTKKESQQNWNLVVEAVEGRFEVLILAIKGPDVGCYEVEIVLSEVSGGDWNSGRAGLHSHQSILRDW